MFGCTAPEFVQLGALDELDSAQIAALAPRTDEPLLVSRLCDGREVTLSKTRLMPHLQRTVGRAERAGATVICVLCTGTFPDLSSCAHIVFPDQLLSATVDALAPGGTLGVIMPHPGQAAIMQRKWSRPNRALVLTSASPYVADDALERAARALHAQAATPIVLDCMGFDRVMQARVRAVCDAPVLLANALIGAVLREFVGSVGGRLKHS